MGYAQIRMNIDFEIRSCKVSSVELDSRWAYGNLVVPRHSQALGLARLPEFSFAMTRDRALQALFDLDNLPPGNDNLAGQYLRNYGLFALGDCVEIKGHPRRIREWWKKSMSMGTTPFATDLSPFWRFQKRIRAHLQLARLFRGRDELALKRACQEINPQLSGRRDWFRTSKQLLISGVEVGLASAHLDIHEKAVESESRTRKMSRGLPNGAIGLVSGIWSPDLRSALYVALLSIIALGDPLEQCKDRGCLRTFIMTRPDREYCSRTCQNRNKQRRSRARLRSN